MHHLTWSSNSLIRASSCPSSPSLFDTGFCSSTIVGMVHLLGDRFLNSLVCSRRKGSDQLCANRDVGCIIPLRRLGDSAVLVDNCPEPVVGIGRQGAGNRQRGEDREHVVACKREGSATNPLV